MFQKRKKHSILRRVREFFWPTMGWHRSGKYVAHRVARLPGTPYTIAAGFAAGAAVSFTPFVGFHFIFAAILAWMIRGNLIASAIGTAVGNPWTFPFIWIWIYKLGLWITRPDDVEIYTFRKMGAIFNTVLKMFTTFKAPPEEVISQFLDIFIPMMVGSIPTSIVVWFLFFIPIRKAVGRYQQMRFEKRTKNHKQSKDENKDDAS